MVEAQKAENVARKVREEAKERLEELRQLHAVDDIRRRLRKGLPCPVCEQVVSTVPKQGKHALLDRAKEAANQQERLVEKAHESLLAVTNLRESLPSEIRRLNKRLGTLDTAIAEIRTKLERVLGKKPSSDPTSELDRLAKQLGALEEGVEQAISQCRSASAKESQARDNLTSLEHKIELLKQKSTSLDSDMNEKKRELNSVEKIFKGWKPNCSRKTTCRSGKS